MELVYLWVKDYKNIKKQGFNFSPRFRCDYENEELKIIDKEETKEPYLKNFFGENIHITAIVGENGSGKSSILASITKGTILVNKNELYTNGFKNSDFLIEENEMFNDDNLIFLDYDFRKTTIENFRNNLDKSFYPKNLYTKVENGTDGDDDFNIYKFREKFYNIILEHFNSFESKLFFFNPVQVSISNKLYKVSNKDEIFKQRNELTEVAQDTKDYKIKFLTYLFFQLSLPEQVSIKIIECNILLSELDIIKLAMKLPIINSISEIKDKLYDFLNLLSAYDNIIQVSMQDFHEIYRTHKKAFLYLINIGFLNINFIDDIEREYYDLSQGERKFFTELLMIYDAIKKSEKQDILLVLDEPDLTLHPDWQKKYIKELLKLLSNFSKKKFHIIITSHSPFILSDIPKENVIFLKDGKQEDVDINPFGANIHTLLSHGVFMQDGLMGEFAKEKINQVYNFITENNTNYIKSKTEAQQIINIIGEPLIKRQLQQLFDEKFEDTIMSLDDEIIFLETKLNALKKIKND